MKVYNGLEFVQNIQNPVLTIGTFDGVHIGHQKIIEQLNDEAKKIGGESVLFTFYPHPRVVLYPESHELKLIQTQTEKIDKLRRMGLQNLVVYPFSEEFAKLSALSFVRDYLVNKIHVKKLVIGYDHQFGKNREGNIEFLKEICDTYDFEVVEIPAQDIDNVKVSSTKIRRAIAEGDMELAAKYLGEPFELYGKVVPGQAIGRNLSFPTANIDVGSDMKLIPKKGVYAVNVLLQDGILYEGMMNIGEKPSINSFKDDLSVEVHLFDFSGSLYDTYVTVQVLKRFREEKKFDSLLDLREQLEEDEAKIRTYFSNHF